MKYLLFLKSRFRGKAKTKTYCQGQYVFNVFNIYLYELSCLLTRKTSLISARPLKGISG